ncbi:hypothetical protein M427DRAFT_307733 [Gonapodya prolifera JEL478]|uniref:Uncharacterized protein n=1 Tax=Gonapodya prolifera (strain JEL478) TaxID=1344416 RepID=A0A139AGV0_GONPJ|nr:hypothetical protein M427DRAFT_307733 [Gonapodya prolifera JEL478]|eukprot:KXS16017.1 hypothetical protein M427DRAFT_307733 [Gonapodya prolifera JEL478]
MGLTTGAVHAARVGTVFILLAKLESDQRQLQDSLHRNLFALSDLRYPSLDQIRFPTTTLHKDESSEYDRAHWNLGQTLANEKRQLEGIVGVTAMATAVDFVAFFVIALCSGCVPAYWISQAFVHLSYFIALFHVIGLFNSNASKANRIVQRAERELAFIIFDLVQARNALAGHPSSHAKSQYSAQTWNGWTRQDSDLSNGNSSNSSGTYLNGDPESTSDPHISVFVETLKSTVNSYQSTLPSFGKREQLSGRSYPLILRDGMAVPREIVESRLREAKAQAKVLEKMALQSSMDENLGKFLGMTMTFESARIFTFSAVMAVVVGYQLFKSGGYSFALAYSCGA